MKIRFSGGVTANSLIITEKQGEGQMEHMLYILVGKGQGNSLKLVPGKEYTVGRHSENDFILEDDNTSRNHFSIQVIDDKYFVTDLDSKNGTFIGERRLSPGIAAEVREGVPIVVGMTIIGLGEVCKSCLKPFLGSAGVFSEMSEEDRDDIELYRVRNTKMNLEFIYNTTYALMESKNTRDIAKKLLNGIFNLLTRIDRCVIILTDDETGEIRYIIYRARKPVDDPTLVYNRDLVEYALKKNKPLMVKDSTIIQDGDAKITQSLQLMKISSAISVPIAGCYGIRGAVYVDSLESPNGFRSSDLALLQDLCVRAALAMDNVSLQQF
jgi:pSer/pThr/pTyr-binding forkhead associated (FHA) protein